MEKQQKKDNIKTEELEKQDFDEIETEEFSDEFRCCVCLDMFYKPVVLACGHIACFWCVFKAMDWQESHCPICRHPYNHFPSICQLLHFVLQKLYPSVYERRERQVTEEEKEFGSCSPQFGDYLSESHSSNKFDILSSSSPHSTTNSLIKDSSEMPRKDCTTIPSTSSYEASRNVTTQDNSTLGSRLGNGSYKQVLMTDLLCTVCKQLLCHPVVLNCGHVYCQVCIINPSNNVCRCQVCQSVHPNGLPKVCLVLEHFLEEQFSEECAARKEAVRKQANCQYASQAICSTQAEQRASQCLSLPTNNYSFLCSGWGPKVHFGAGCDYCGMCPIIGERYRCKDCKEKIGFDLCEGCYNSSSKLPGRFNQQHTPEHKFEIKQPKYYFIRGIEAEHVEQDGSDDPESLEDVSQASISSGDTPMEPEDGVTAPVSSNDTSEDQEASGSTA